LQEQYDEVSPRGATRAIGYEFVTDTGGVGLFIECDEKIASVIKPLLSSYVGFDSNIIPGSLLSFASHKNYYEERE
jgi:hypothetical protein